MKVKKEKRAKDTENNIKVKTEHAGEEEEVQEEGFGANLSYEEKLSFVSIIAKPMASKKLAKRVYKLIKKGSKHKGSLRNGLKDVQRRIRKGEKGLVVFAGDVTPIDIMCHMPGVCEGRDIPYIFTPSRQDLGSAMGVRRGSLMVMILEHADYKELYDDCVEEISALPIPTG